ncbi:glycoside hydrolase family 68 protein [Spiroplasma platyhelix]|uniref:Glycoside hydrolase family 68 protein n=1 Tax=Spiroplasma platyhelix PALS-1 TaxID=1276218 RepID=A0A846TPU1_9MOLU|nr:glycoside hydrolase family 68 protein [Spiroplasma platyhelix]MBE4703927.1 hypothetical protein [Spiroplasma platyhelix PALS-1]NKE38300.1 glycoside hydrolase family 68 protein [Spiroplasma platyhelix PALS-1]UJB29185.1 levansucrase [Spiroplasma platyhelix PALS-1]
MKKLLSLLAALTLGSTGTLSVVGCGPNNMNDNAQMQTYRWTEMQASKTRFTSEKLTPKIDYSNKTAFIENYDIWDSWALLTNDGSVAVIDGYMFWFALSKPLDGSVASKIMFFYSKTGSNWVSGGYALAENLIAGTEEWSGSAMYDEQSATINLFYTVSNYTFGANWNQRIALAKMKLVLSEGKPSFEKPYYHAIIADADGDLYQTHDDAEAEKYDKQKWAFRDPFYFKDPKTNKEYLLFEGNTGKLTGKENERLSEYTGGFKDYSEDYDFERSNHANSAIGIADLDLVQNKVTLLNPLWASNLVSDETERPAMIYNAEFNRYYLFTTTHGYYNMNLAAELNKKDSLHGFTAKNSLFQAMTPINGDGLILYSNAEKDEDDQWNADYSYAWGVLKDNKESNCLLTLAFSNFSSQGNDSELKKLRGAAPTLGLKIDDDKIVLDFELLPAQVVR